MDPFSSRSRALTPELKQMIRQYTEKHGKTPSKRTVWLLGQQAAQNTRRTKADSRRTVAGQTGAAEPTDAQRLAAWEAQTVREEVQALSAVHEQAEQFTRRAIPVLDESAKARAARIAVAEVQMRDGKRTRRCGCGPRISPRSPRMTPTAGSGAPMRKPPTSAPQPHGWPTICKARTFSCWPVRTRITAAPLTGARSISNVLHGRLQAIKLDEHAHDVTWAQRTPETAPDVAHEVAGGLDSRLRELGERVIAGPQPWLLKHLGMLNPNASPALREDYARRAGIAAGYREAARITDPEQAISPEPHSASPELDAMREATIRALEITEDPYRAMTRGQLEATVAEGGRTQALAPPDVSGQLRLTAQAEADAWQQSADAEVRHDQAEAASAKALAGQLGAEKARLEAIHASAEYIARIERQAQAEPQPDWSAEREDAEMEL